MMPIKHGSTVEVYEEWWKEFWEAMDEINIWNWSSEYYLDVCDSFSWSLKLSYRNKSTSISGHEGAPAINDLNKTIDIDESQHFSTLLRAFNNLIDKDSLLA